MATVTGKVSSWVKHTKKLNEARKSFTIRLHEYLSSKYFVEEVTDKLWNWAIFLKLLAVFCIYTTFNRESLTSVPSVFVFVLFYGFLYLGNLFIYPVDYKWNRRYDRKEYTQEGFSWNHFFADPSTYMNIYDFVVHLVFPFYYWMTGTIGFYQIIIGAILMTMNLSALYGFYHFDFLPLMNHRNNMVLYDWKEMNQKPKLLTILESTPNYISIKNVSEMELKTKLTIIRRIEENYTFRKENGERGNGIRTTSNVSVDYPNIVIPSGTVFKCVTTEFEETEKEDGELVDRLLWLRSFGPAKGETVKTFLDFYNDGKYYNVEMVQKYQYGEKQYVYDRQIPSETPSICDSNPTSDCDSVSSFQML